MTTVVGPVAGAGGGPHGLGGGGGEEELASGGEKAGWAGCVLSRALPPCSAGDADSDAPPLGGGGGASDESAVPSGLVDPWGGTAASPGVPAAGSGPGCSVSSLMWILLKGRGPAAPRHGGWLAPVAPAVQRTSCAMLRDADRGPASGRASRRGSVSAACHAELTLN